MPEIAVPEEKVTEYGVRFPDGTEAWTDAATKSLKILTAADRAAFVAARNQVLEAQGVANDPGVVFLTRERVITRTAPKELKD